MNTHFTSKFLKQANGATVHEVTIPPHRPAKYRVGALTDLGQALWTAIV
jgi:hypothetical protein